MVVVVVVVVVVVDPRKLRGGDVQKCNLHFPMFSDLKNVSLHFFGPQKCKLTFLRSP